MDILLMAGIFILLVVYVAILIHLKPSLKSKKSHEDADIESEIVQQSPEEEHAETSVQPTIIPVKAKETAEEPPKAIEPPEEPIAEFQTPKESASLPSKEVSKIEELITHKAKEIPKKAGPPGCSYYFGYLGQLPKNDPIPDDCLGCFKLMECLIKQSTNSKT